METVPALTLPTSMQDLTEARARYLATGEASASVRPVVLASWERSRAYGVNPAAVAVQRPDAGRTRAALTGSQRLVEGAAEILRQMHATLGDAPHLIALTDADGVVLVTHTSAAGTDEELRAANLFVGASWHERDVGCNGAGTALAEDQPVVLIGPEHFADMYVGWTCVGVPIRDASGAVVGALDVSAPREFMNVSLWGWTLAVARNIEDAVGRWTPGTEAEAGLAVPDIESPLQTLHGIIEVLAAQLSLSPTHAALLQQSREQIRAAAAQLQSVMDAAVRSEHAARRELSEIESLYASAPVGLCMLDRELRYLRINRRLAEINGVPAEEHIGRTVRDVLPDLADLAEPVLMDVLETGRPRLNVELSGETPARPGQVRQWLEQYHPLVDERGEVFGINVVVEDVTERRRSQRELAAEREFLRTLVDSIPIMVTVYDPAIEEIVVNAEFVRLLGWTNEDLRRVNVMEAVYPDPEYRESVRRFMSSLDGWRDLELRARDGRVVPSAWANIRVADDRQVGIGVDLTIRKQLEDEVKEAYLQTRRALKERDSVIAVVSHDLRNPLNTVMMAASLLQEDVSAEKKERQASLILRAARQMKRLVDDLLEVSRMEAGTFAVNCASCAPADLIRAAADAMIPLAEQRGIDLMTHVDRIDGDVRVRADGDRVLQVMTNLIDNAIAHTPQEGRVLLDAKAEDGHVVFRVVDTGRGIAAEDQPHVFDRFWQAAQGGRSGAGLGLAIAKGIVEAHGGAIAVESVEGSGSTFSFTLPRWPEDGAD